MSKSKVSLVRCASYQTQEVEAAVKASIELLGGLEKFIKPADTVLIKPNLLTDSKPEEGITTHPEVVRAVIRAIKPLTKNIYCGDSPSVWGEKKDIDRVYETSGIKKVCAEEGVELAYFALPKMYGAYPLTDWLAKCDRLISVPKFKTHGLTVLTVGIKNLFGLVVGMYKMTIHRDHFLPSELSKALVDIYEIRKPDLTILDAIVAMEGEGPGSCGSLRQMDLVAASSEALALDVVLSDVIGLKPEDIPTNKEAFKRGLNPQGLEQIEILGEGVKIFEKKDFKLPKASVLNSAPLWVNKIAKNIFRMKPVILCSKCRLCSRCHESCPVKAVEIENKRMKIDYKKCILCLCCQEICPHGAIAIRKNFILQILGLFSR